MRQLSQQQRLALEYAIEYGEHYLAYFHVQDGLEYFFDELGLVSYQVIRSGPLSLFGADPITVVLGGPLCRPHDRRELTKRFLRHHRKEVSGNDPSFLQVRSDFSSELSTLGYDVNRVGMDANVDIETFELSGRRMRNLKKAWNCGARDDIVVREASVGDIDLSAALEISENWRRSKRGNRKERRFLSFPFVLDDEPEQRKYFAYDKEGLLAGFVFFTPVFGGGRVSGFAPNIIRSRAGVSPDVTDHVVLTALRDFRQEGLKELALGICPLYGLEKPELSSHNRSVGRFLRANLRWTNWRYGFRQLTFHKTRYRPRLTPIFWALPRQPWTRSERTWRQVFAGSHVCGVL